MAEYRRLLIDLCQHVGIRSWSEILSSQHIDIDGMIVGLIPCEEDERRDLLSVYIDLGPIPAECEPEVHRQMLVANTHPHFSLRGCFGLHPQWETAIHHVQVEMSHYDGASFAEFLTAQTRLAKIVFGDLVKNAE